MIVLRQSGESRRSGHGRRVLQVQVIELPPSQGPSNFQQGCHSHTVTATLDGLGRAVRPDSDVSLSGPTGRSPAAIGGSVPIPNPLIPSNSQHALFSFFVDLRGPAIDQENKDFQRNSFFAVLTPGVSPCWLVGFHAEAAWFAQKRYFCRLESAQYRLGSFPYNTCCAVVSCHNNILFSGV